MAKKKTKLNPQVFRDAAVIASDHKKDQEDFCCWAINRAIGKNVHFRRSGYLRYLDAVLKPEITPWCAWYNTGVEGLDRIDDTMELIHNARVIGLLLCAILLEEGYQP